MNKTRQMAEMIRKARDLMNHGGRHWIKGDEKVLVDPNEHVPGGNPDNYAYADSDNTEMVPAFCSIGALYEVGAGREVILEVARAMNAETVETALERAKKALKEEIEHLEDCGVRPMTSAEKKQFLLDDIDEDTIVNIITTFNDDDETTWSDVRGAFTKAAKRLADRARKA